MVTVFVAMHMKILIMISEKPANHFFMHTELKYLPFVKKYGEVRITKSLG